MPLRRVSTAQYDEAARVRLARAVSRGREASGYSSRAAFAEEAGISLRSLVDLEQAKPRVGQKTLEAVGRAMAGWSEDTPRLILEGAEPPSAQPDPAAEPVDLRAVAVYDLATLIATDAPTREYLAAMGRWQARLGEHADMHALAEEAQALSAQPALLSATSTSPDEPQQGTEGAGQRTAR